jgi:hypothetical protein
LIPPAVLAFAVSASLLLSFHVAADSKKSSSSSPREDEFSFYERVRRGPQALEPVDKLLFGTLILLAFELLNYLARHSGRTFLFRLPLPKPSSH